MIHPFALLPPPSSLIRSSVSATIVPLCSVCCNQQIVGIVHLPTLLGFGSDGATYWVFFWHSESASEIAAVSSDRFLAFARGRAHCRTGNSCGCGAC